MLFLSQSRDCQSVPPSAVSAFLEVKLKPYLVYAQMRLEWISASIRRKLEDSWTLWRSLRPSGEAGEGAGGIQRLTVYLRILSIRLEAFTGGCYVMVARDGLPNLPIISSVAFWGSIYVPVFTRAAGVSLLKHTHTHTQQHNSNKAKQTNKQASNQPTNQHKPQTKQATNQARQASTQARKQTNANKQPTTQTSNEPNKKLTKQASKRASE